MKTDVFALRHIGPRDEHLKEMLEVVGVNSIEELIDQTVPDNIRLQTPLNLDSPLSEQEYLEHIYHLASKNKVYKSYHWFGLSSFKPSRCDSAKYFRKSRLVYSLYTLSS